MRPSRLAPYAVVAGAAAIPRLAVLALERSDITAAFVDKGAVFAETFVASGTYGFIPGIPSAYTQPLYGFVLVPIDWVADGHWLAVGFLHLALSVAAALLVYELGRRLVSSAAGVVAGLISTLHPYLVWHDMHMNREVVDQVLAVALVLTTLVALDRRSVRWAAFAGAITGVAILGNVRLLFVPIVLAAFFVAARAPLAAAVLAGCAAVVVTPWVVRNEVSVGCAALTTDSRALWKANNENTLETLRAGRWIDDVPPVDGAPPTPQEAWGIYATSGRIVETDECEQMRFYREEALEWMRENPREKAVLAGVAARMLWQPRVTITEGRPAEGTWVDVGREWVEPIFVVALYAFAIAGVRYVPRRYLALAIALLAYHTLTAMAFAGETRYRAPWDFLAAIPAAAAALALIERVRSRPT